MRLSPVLAVSALLLAAPPAALAEDPVVAGQSIIERQIAAFLKNDADAAYSYASPTIKSIFPDKDRFFDMVRKSYAPVYRPGNYAFGRSKSINGGETVIQELLITGTEGKDYSAVYQLQRQPDGSYKINGVQMLRTTQSTGI